MTRGRLTGVLVSLVGLVIGAALAVSPAAAVTTGGHQPPGPGNPGGPPPPGGPGPAGPGHVCFTPTGAGSCPGPGTQCVGYPAMVPVAQDPTGAWLDSAQWAAKYPGTSPFWWQCGTPTAPIAPPGPPPGWSANLAARAQNGTVKTDPAGDFLVFETVTATAAHTPVAPVFSPPVPAGGQTYQYEITFDPNVNGSYMWSWGDGSTSQTSGPTATKKYTTVSNGVTITATHRWTAHCWVIVSGPNGTTISPNPCSPSDPGLPNQSSFNLTYQTPPHRILQMEAIPVAP